MQTIIFDFDGTIADSFPFVVDFLRRQAGVPEPLTVEQQLTYRHVSMAGMARLMGISWVRLPNVFIRGRREMNHHLMHVKPFDGMPEVVTKLHKDGYRLFVLSSNRAANIKPLLKQYGLEGCFERVYGKVSLFGKAPALRQILKNHQLNVEDCLYIGDETRDIEACNAIGMRCIAVEWGFASHEFLAALHPFQMVQKPAQISRVIKESERARRTV